MARLAVALLFVLVLSAQTARDLKFERVAPPLPDKKARWAVVVGVSSYKYAPPAAQLRYAHRDAEEFAKLLRSPEGGGFPKRSRPRLDRRDRNGRSHSRRASHLAAEVGGPE